MSLRHQAVRVVRRVERALAEQPAPAAPTKSTIDAQDPLTGPDMVDVRTLLGQYTVEQLSEAAEDYYRGKLDSVDYFHSKPVADIDEAPDLLICFAQVLAGVRPIKGMRVLDFGAGTGWTSRMLTQLGCQVVVCDVSAAALDMARELFARQPVAGEQPEPEFLLFDGQRLDLPDGSVDRIVCVDAFHHVPNPAHVLAELGRVLAPGGVAGFQEPGPNHSKASQSQFEMKQFTVIENDIIMADVERWARDAGFSDLELAVFTPGPFHTSIAGYDDFLAGGATRQQFFEAMQPFVEQRRIFFLSKGSRAEADSRERRGLGATLAVDLTSVSVGAGGSVSGHVTATNTGSTRWLPSHAPVGPVRLGVHLLDGEGIYLDREYARADLPDAGPDGHRPSDTISFDVVVPAPAEPGSYRLEFDLVAEHVAWFETNGASTVTIPITVT
jgi:SAM-dependent methyltransferase